MKFKTNFWLRSLIIIFLISSFTLVGCDVEEGTSNTVSNGQTPTSTPTPTETVTPTDTPTPTSTDTTPTETMTNNSLPRLEGKATVKMMVNGSAITIEVDGENAPITAGNFVDLVNRKVYDGLVFHRVVRQPQPFVVQGGDPQSKDPNFAGMLGTGGFIDPETNQQRYIPLEIKVKGEDQPIYSRALGQQGRNPVDVVLPHRRGAVAMARSQMPDSASAQFYFALSQLDFLDGDYAVFGYVTEGMDVVDKIEQGDRIESATVVSGLENLKK
jgi:peptidyl-prolyl cis-trans isomerase B (cyclophilin B)